MDILPPSPHDGFLRTPIPDLGTVGSCEVVLAQEAGRMEQALLSRDDSGSLPWLSEVAGLHRDRGRLSLALRFASDAIEQAHHVGSDEDLVHALSMRASIQVLQGNFNSARETLNDARPLIVGDAKGRMAALYEETFATLLLRTIGSTVFEFEEAGERYARAIQFYAELDDIPGQVRGFAGSASVYSGRGQYLVALEQVDKGILLSAKAENWRHLGQLLGCASFAFRDQGYRSKVNSLFELSIQWATFVGDIPQRIRSIGGQAELSRMEFTPPDQEALDKTVTLMQRAIREAREIGAGPMMLEMQMALATAYRKAGDRESQRKCRELAEQIAASEAFEGAHRLIDWNDFIEDRLVIAREERIASRLEEAIEGSADPFFVFDSRQGSEAAHFDLLNEFRNSAANRMLNIDPTDVRLLGDLLLTPQFAGLREPLIKAALDRGKFEDEILVPVADGDSVWYARRVAPAGSGAVVTFRDVTTSHRIEDALRVAADKAREADQAKSEFLANMSHEVRTPINGVLGLARLLQDLDLNPVARKYVDGIVSSGNILLKVIGDVLDLSKIEARKMQVNAGPFNIQVLTDEVVGLFAGQASESGVSLSAEIEPEVPTVVLVDGAYLRRVLANLVGNAVKFTEKGRIDVRVSRQGDMLDFEVCDTGVGVPADQLEAIFEPFQQALAEADWGGTGLGLTISRRLIEQMGGRMGVSSIPGKGSRFFFNLPLVELIGQSVVESAPVVEESRRFEGRSVLVVDDNAVNALVAEGMASRLGCSVTTAENGREALDLLADSPFDLILMDMRMPVMDGLTATRTIREKEMGTGKHTPIIALTAGALAQEREACLEAGMDDYLVKPFTMSALREVLYKALG
jgi:signal transduction histidine kinase/CheY-like chemotaxis protein